jgi:gluconokinase
MLAEGAHLGEVIIVMGVTGVGKSTLVAALAAERGVPFLEGDSFHPPENVRKMSAGIPLQDADRWPWLDLLGQAIAARREPSGVVAACSALKRSYRDRLRAMVAEPLWFVCLQAERTAIARRMQARQGHYMPVALLDSQLATLELPGRDERAIVLSADDSVPDMLARLRAHIMIGSSHGQEEVENPTVAEGR